jgi:tyrosine-protein phosphatase
MSFPKVLERNEHGLSEVLRPMQTGVNATFQATIEEEDSPIRPQMASRSEFQPYSEEANNEDQKTPGYPDGPIAIYDDNVFLYLEPTAEEASRFDVVINVAREVKNPFEVLDQSRPFMDFSPRSQSTDSDMSPIPDTAVSTASFATAFEFQPGEDRMDTPTTPKANPLSRPEYIHIPWDHNTDIAPDLMRLCETVDGRIKEGKKVLIHCQQGASRSASLIIAYGLYRNSELSVNDAYYAAQAKSRWISPNMKLMYSLQDFQKEVTKQRLPPRPRAGRSPTKHRLTMSADAIDISAKEPRTAPLPGDELTIKEGEAFQGVNRPRGNSSPGRPPVSPGPASAPASFAWNDKKEDEPESAAPELIVPSTVSEAPERPKSGHGRTESGSLNPFAAPALSQPPPSPGFAPSRPPPSPGFAPLGSMGFHSMGFHSMGFQSLSFPRFRSKTPEPRPSSRFLGERTIAVPAPSYPSDDMLLSPRAETMTANPLQKIPEVAGMKFIESPPTPTEGLFSPRVTMFPRDPLVPFGRPPQIADPRSPPTVGESPIVRSIDDILWGFLSRHIGDYFSFGEMAFRPQTGGSHHGILRLLANWARRIAGLHPNGTQKAFPDWWHATTLRPKKLRFGIHCTYLDMKTRQ